MAKRKLTLSRPFAIGPGLSQTHLELDYVYVDENSLRVFTKQKNVITVPMTAHRQKFLEDLENDCKAELEK